MAPADDCLRPSLPLEQMGREAGRLLLESIRGQRTLSQIKVLATLLPRASSAGKETGKQVAWDNHLATAIPGSGTSAEETVSRDRGER